MGDVRRDVSIDSDIHKIVSAAVLAIEAAWGYFEEEEGKGYDDTGPSIPPSGPSGRPQIVMSDEPLDESFQRFAASRERHGRPSVIS